MGQTPPRMRDLDIHDHNLGTIYNPYTVLYVPKGCVEAYRAAPYWRQFMHILEMNEDMGVQPVMTTDKQTDGYTYDLQGHRMVEGHPLLPGIYVRNGRKVIVRK